MTRRMEPGDKVEILTGYDEWLTGQDVAPQSAYDGLIVTVQHVLLTGDPMVATDEGRCWAIPERYVRLIEGDQ